MKREAIMLHEAAIMADSFEVMSGYYSAQLKYWETELNKLNLMEHPCEIQVICKKILACKGKLAFVNLNDNEKY